jgi:TolA-binding protein
MGITGDDQRMDAAIISDTVNSASRVESLSKYYSANILLSEDSINCLETPDAFSFRYLGKVQVKGKNNSLKIYECFDGDTDEVIEKKKASLDAFNDGMMHYFAKDFAMAALGFQQVIKENPDDATAKLFLQKSGQLIATGVPQDWDGVEVMSSK